MAKQFRVLRGMGRGVDTPTGDAELEEEGVASVEVCGGSMLSNMILRSFVDISLLLLSGGEREGSGGVARSVARTHKC